MGRGGASLLGGGNGGELVQPPVPWGGLGACRREAVPNFGSGGACERVPMLAVGGAGWAGNEFFSREGGAALEESGEPRWVEAGKSGSGRH